MSSLSHHCSVYLDDKMSAEWCLAALAVLVLSADRMQSSSLTLNCCDASDIVATCLENSSVLNYRLNYPLSTLSFCLIIDCYCLRSTYFALILLIIHRYSSCSSDEECYY